MKFSGPNMIGGQAGVTLRRSVAWNDGWKMASLRLSFPILPTYDRISSENNQFEWRKDNDPACSLSDDKPRTFKHTLSSCAKTPRDVRCTWRHNRAFGLCIFEGSYMKSEPAFSTQCFVCLDLAYILPLSEPIKHGAVPCKYFLDQVEIGLTCLP